jgi:Tfp pilus assembly protein FimT
MKTGIRRPEAGRRPRHGFTLMEISIVLLILIIVMAVVTPALVSFGRDRQLTTVDLLIGLLRDSRRLAIQQGATVTVLLDPQNGHFRVDSVSPIGAGIVVEDTLDLGVYDQLESDKPRLRYVFASSGAAFADSLTIRGSDSTRVLFVDPWSGIAYAIAR